METTESNVSPNDQLVFTDTIKEYLIEISKWVKFFAILGVIGIGLMVIAALSMIVVGTAFSSFTGGRAIFPVGLFSVVYLLIALLYAFPVYYLFKTSSGLKQGIKTNNQGLFTSGFENFKSFHKFLGIMTIIVLSIYIVIILGVLLVAVLHH
jgi:hypothetical protein